MTAKKKARFDTDTIMLILIVALIVIFVVNMFVIFSMSSKLQERKKDVEETARPAEIELTTLSLADCPDCFDVNKFLEDIKKQSVEVTSEKTMDANSAAGKALIAQYGIQKLPTVIASGEVNKINVANFFNKWNLFDNNKTAVYTAQLPPYYNVSESRVVGRVSLTILNAPSCTKCQKIDPAINSFKQAGVKFVDERTIDYNSAEGKQLISKNNIQAIPAAVISDEIDVYPGMTQVFKQLNAVTREGYYAVAVTRPPYINTTTNKIAGLVDIIYLKDDTCSNCYNVSQHRVIVTQAFAIALDEEKTLDVSSAEGKQLISKYKIEKVPTMLLSPDADAYPALKTVWIDPRQGVGTIESDGWYVFRATELMGNWKNVTSGQVVSRG
jgi:thiol-disulfide isomerase/thioredoxin